MTNTSTNLVDQDHMAMFAPYRKSLVAGLADRSGSMAGAKIDGLNDGLALLEKELRNDPIAFETVSLDVVTVTFSPANKPTLPQRSRSWWRTQRAADQVFNRWARAECHGRRAKEM